MLEEQIRSALQQHLVIFKPVSVLLKAIFTRLTITDLSLHTLNQILNSMIETHRSMYIILHSSANFESKHKKFTGAHADALILTRPQIDSSFLILMLLHGDIDQVKKYHRSTWFSSFILISNGLHKRNLDETNNLIVWNKITKVFGILGLKSGLNEEEIDSVFNACRNNRKPQDIPNIRTPRTRSIATKLLDNPLLKNLVAPLLEQYEIACDTTHVGISILAPKSLLRGDFESPEELTRNEYLIDNIYHDSLSISIITLLTCSSAITLRMFDDDCELRNLCLTAWNEITKQVYLSTIIWNDWAKQYFTY